MLDDWVETSNMPQKLILAGCSWGCGEWIVDKNNEYELCHPGLSEYLQTDFDVVNISRIGASNWQICYAIRNYLTYVQTYEQFKIIVIQTDAYRPHSSEKFQVDYSDLFNESSDLKNFYERSLEIFYIKLDSLAQQFNTKIYLVGGLNDLASNILPLYTNLVPICQSWTYLIDHSYTPDIVPLILNYRLYKDAKHHMRADLMEQISTYSDQNFLKAQQLMETDWFGPSYGDFHPSRKGHELLANYIKDYFKKEEL